jgi:hypothetical protein
MDVWKQRYEDALCHVVETKNEYDFVCQQHHELIHMVQRMQETLSSIKQLLRTCSPENYDVLEEQHHCLFDAWNYHSSEIERLTGQRYREMVHASEHASLLFHRAYPY